jgi:hypothetical protein
MDESASFTPYTRRRRSRKTGGGTRCAASRTGQSQLEEPSASVLNITNRFACKIKIHTKLNFQDETIAAVLQIKLTITLNILIIYSYNLRIYRLIN